MLQTPVKRTKQEVDEEVGREQLIALLEERLMPSSYLLDIGCGELRCAQWVIPLLSPEHYCGLEPRREELEHAIEEVLPPGLVEFKRPRFDHNGDFDFSVFGVKFTHFVARSIWSHCSKGQIEAMLDGVVAHGAPNAVMLASFRAIGSKRANDYKGEEWKGISHDSDEPGIVAHDIEWIRVACEERGLLFELSARGPIKKNGQVWAVVRKTDGDAERLRALRASGLARQIKQSLKVMKLSTLRLIDEAQLDA